MSDYTPTTKEVRGVYSMGEPAEINAFDRWLYKEYAEHVDIGYAIAVAKIIKLLEEPTADWHNKWEQCESYFCFCSAIALIKRENK